MKSLKQNGSAPALLDTFFLKKATKQIRDFSSLLVKSLFSPKKKKE